MTTASTSVTFVDEPKACENLRANIRRIMLEKNISTQKAFATETDITESTLTNILKGSNNKLPNLYPFLVNLSTFSGYTLEQLLNTRIPDAEEVSEDSYEASDWHRIEGMYQVYYYDTSKYAGHENLPDGSAICFGLLLIYKKEGSDSHGAVAVLGLTRSDMAKLFNEINRLYKTKEHLVTHKAYHYIVENESRLSDHLYRGDITLINNFFNVNLAFRNLDCVSMLFYRPGGTADHYIGGLGAVLSISRGRQVTPCSQLMGLSRYDLRVSTEEIAQNLLITSPEFDIQKEAVNDVISFMKEAFAAPAPGTPSIDDINLAHTLSDDEKSMIIFGKIRKIITDSIYRNMFRISKLTGGNDDDFYHFLKRSRK